MLIQDVASSWHGSSKFGSTLDSRNVIHISPLFGVINRNLLNAVQGREHDYSQE